MQQGQGRWILAAIALVITLGGWMIKRTVDRSRCCEEEAPESAG